MDSSVPSPQQSSGAFLFQEVKRIVWGDSINDDLFKRWSQGFILGVEEPTALIQLEGGPCAIIAPVQAFILKYVLSDSAVLQDNLWRRVQPQIVDEYLVKALSEILCQTRNSGNGDVCLPPNSPPSKLALFQTQTSSSLLHGPINEQDQRKNESPCRDQFSIVFLNEPLSRFSQDSDSECLLREPRTHRTEQDIFHRSLRVLHLENTNQVEQVLRDKLDVFKGSYGILQFLYSVILTKGIDQLSNEMSEASELIDPTHGHGSQSLINLMLTGRGVNYVWDNEEDVGGLKLVGIIRPVEIGFLTLLERLRYCEVGSFFKNPKFPIWVVGSETHLTVLFSTNMRLVCPETPSEMARRVFNSFACEGNNFISSILLEDVLRTLDLVSDAEYVEIIKTRLDPETLGIILLNDFMDEFFCDESRERPDSFVLYHYNGLPTSYSNRRVMYQQGNAILLESDIRCLSDDNKILTCLQTKWPSIDITWTGGSYPSIN